MAWMLGKHRFKYMMLYACIVLFGCGFSTKSAAAPSARQLNPPCAGEIAGCDQATAYAECADEVELAKADPGFGPGPRNWYCKELLGNNIYQITNSDNDQAAGLNDYRSDYWFTGESNTDAKRPNQNLGQPQCHDQCFGDPVNSGTGNKFERKVEYRGSGDFPLELSWTYNSEPLLAHFPSKRQILGKNRSHFYFRTLSYFDFTSLPTVFITRPDGKAVRFTKSSGAWSADRPADGSLNEILASGQIVGWTYANASGGLEVFSGQGLLTELQDANGRVQSLSYDAQSRLSQVSDQHDRTLSFFYNSSGLVDEVVLPDGQSIGFDYTPTMYLDHVAYQDGSSVGHLYNEAELAPSYAAPGLLTGVVDELEQRYSSTSYEQSLYSNLANANSVQLAGGADIHSATYDLAVNAWNYATTSSVTTPDGAARTSNFSVVHGIVQPTSIETSCAGCTTRTKSYTYDASGQLDTLNNNGVVTDYDYDAHGLLVSQIDAADNTSGAKRTMQTDWNQTFKAPTEQRILDATGVLVSRKEWNLNTRGQTLSASRTDPSTNLARVETLTYCEPNDIAAGTCPIVGLVLTRQGPRTNLADTTSYAYYSSDDAACISAPYACPHRKGDLWKVTDALGHVTETLSYDGAGRPLSVKDANGVITDYAYHPRGWLTATKVRGVDNGTETDDRITRMEYWPTGLVKKVTQPDGAFTAYSYDAAHRLTDVTDNAGNTIHYTLDNAGNRIAEQTKDASGTLKRTLSRVYNQLGQLATQADAAANPTDFGYDANGNTTLVTDALGKQTQSDYDPLNRLKRTLQDVGGIAAETKFAYDSLDNLTEVTDPKGLKTTYSYNGLGDLTQQVSPDTGTTLFTYDSAGNRATQTDARNKTTTYSYDALNRLTGMSYSTTALNVAYTYDTTQSVCAATETFSAGRLTRMQDGSGTTQYCYNRFGDLTRKVQTVNGVALTLRYSYAPGGQLTAMTYPDGAVVDYVRDVQGRVTEIGVTPNAGARQVLLTGASYHPFGPVAGWTYGNGRQMSRTLDLDYRPAAIHDGSTGGLSVGFNYDAVGNLVELTQAGSSLPQVGLGYDALGRLTQFKDGPTGTPIDTYGYDKTGNRTSLTSAAGTSAYTYPTTSHRLTNVGGIARTYDTAGNTTAINGTARQFVYDDTGRLNAVKQSNATVRNYRYNGKGERTRSWVGSNNNTYTLYDEAGHWLGDYVANGTPVQQAIWMDDLPVGLRTAAAGTLTYIEPDHLGSPRVVIEPVANTAIWKWNLKSEAFGATAPEQDPDANGTAFNLNMRFPGQRYDAATGLNYNYFRDYDSSVGRYAKSDPIGLNGGISSYGYVSEAPFSKSDPKGLIAFGPTCSQQMRNSIIQAVVELSNDISGAANSASKSCKDGSCDFSFASQVMRNVATMTFSCDNSYLCAQAVANGVAYFHPAILTAPTSSRIHSPGQCGCLKATIFHEAGHQADLGMKEDDVRRKTLGCVSCAQNMAENGGPL